GCGGTVCGSGIHDTYRTHGTYAFYENRLATQSVLHFAQLAQVLERVNAGVVSVVPGDFVGVMADRRHRDRPRRAGLQLFLGDDAKRIRRLRPLLPAGCTGAVLAQGLPGDRAAAAVGPFDVQSILTLAANDGRTQRWRSGCGHRGIL